MTRAVCDFKFDGATYVVLATIDDSGDVRDVSGLTENKGALSGEVKRVCSLLGALMRDGMPFEYLETMKQIAPLQAAIISSIGRERDRVQACLKSLPRAQMLSGDPLT